jgi:protein phosphatase
MRENLDIDGQYDGRTPATGLEIKLPEAGLVVLVGASGCGKSTFAQRNFKPTEVLSSDTFRAWVSDDELDQSATTDAFDVLHYLAATRLRRGKMVVVDATNVQRDARAALLHLAHSQNVLCNAIVFVIPESICQERNRSRKDRQVPPHAIRRQCDELRRNARSISREGFQSTCVLNPSQMNAARVVRTRLWNDKRDDHGPFDIIGDVHGCNYELNELLTQLGYDFSADSGWSHPKGRRVIFIGDLVDRGPGVVETLNLVRRMVDRGAAFAVAGNHDDKLLRWLKGRKVSITHGVQVSIDEIESLDDSKKRDWKETTARFLDSLISHYVFDDGKLVVAHAGLIEGLQGRASRTVRDFCLYGDTTGEIDVAGLPVRRDWAADYRGQGAVVYGHTPQAEAAWINNTINIDTGCVFGGSLTALRWPERELVSVKAKSHYAVPGRPFLPDPLAEPMPSRKEVQFDLMLSDVVEGATIGSNIPTFGESRRVITDLAGTVKIEPENGAAALELMSRFAVDPRWLVYLPPTMSPCETEPPGEPYLEHPRAAFAYFRNEGVSEVICEEKHMGSRAVIVICRDAATANRRFGTPLRAGIGECYTRTGRRFFDLPTTERFLEKVRAAMDRSGFWDTHATDWAVIDCEILPWNAKAQGLLREQYAPVGAAASASLNAASALMSAAKARGLDVGPMDFAERKEAIAKYIAAYRAYCWSVDGLDGVQVAPFHLLATEGHVHSDKDHSWHLSSLQSLVTSDSVLFRPTHCLRISLSDESSYQMGIDWWLRKTEASAEGMVVKPHSFLVYNQHDRLLQPAIKCRGREYLRIIYGPEYTLPTNIEALRRRSTGRKRGLAQREFALGLEGLTRFVSGEPLHRYHECAFAVLALESEPVDPRL